MKPEADAEWMAPRARLIRRYGKTLTLYHAALLVFSGWAIGSDPGSSTLFLLALVGCTIFLLVRNVHHAVTESARRQYEADSESST